jgi:hypothetical protein
VKSPKETLHEIEDAPPGQRFQRLYRRRQQSRHARAFNIAFNVGGVAVIAIGIATYPVPVIPSEIVILVGIALVAQGSLRAAKILDGIEARLRRPLAPLLRLWRRLPTWARRTLAVAWMVAIAGLSYWAYRAIAD